MSMLLEAGMGGSRRRRRGFAPVAFSPTQLFANGEQGAWYDPSDFSTLYQNSNGTLPVTALGQPVGLVLDKSKGLVLGNELVDTANTAAAWTVYGNNTVTQDGSSVKVTFVDNANGAFLTLNAAGGLSSDLVTGTTYKISFTARVNTGSVDIQSTLLGSFATVVSVASQTDTTYSFIQTSAVTPQNAFIRIAGMGSGEIAYISNISVKAVPGNHARQTTDAARPTVQARSNLLIRTEEFENAAWTKAVATISANQATSPTGTLTADLCYPNTTGTFRGFYQTYTGAASPTNSIYAKASGVSWFGFISHTGASGAAWFNVSNGTVGTVLSGYTATIQDVGNGWYRCNLVRNSGTIGTFLQVFLADADNSTTVTASGTNGILFWGSQAELGASATTYQRVTTATDYADIGLPRALRFDGTDDFLVTAANLNMTASDEATVVGGIFKQTDATTGVVLELGSGGDSGSFRVFTGTVASTEKYAYRSQGTLSAIASTTSTIYNAPHTGVITGLSDISAKNVVLRVNGTQVGSSTGDQGTGNYTSALLYVGSRNGTTLRFNGRIHQLIVRGALTSGAQLTSTEQFVAQKTGISI